MGMTDEDRDSGGLIGAALFALQQARWARADRARFVHTVASGEDVRPGDMVARDADGRVILANRDEAERRARETRERGT